MNLVANSRQSEVRTNNATHGHASPPNVLLNVDRKAVSMLKAIYGCRAVLEPVAGGLKVSGVDDGQIKGLISLISSLSFSSVTTQETVQQELIASNARIAELEEANAQLQKKYEQLEGSWSDINVANIRLKQELQAKRNSPAPQQPFTGTPHRLSTVVYPGRQRAA